MPLGYFGGAQFVFHLDRSFFHLPLLLLKNGAFSTIGGQTELDGAEADWIARDVTELRNLLKFLGS
jgi:hypothetical protein